jgi:DNA-binding GntR family transcriptional regulator
VEALEAIAPARSISEIVYDKLKEAIVSNVFKKGERLVELEIATKLKVSRTPVRSALQRLESVGMLEGRAGRGFFVKEFSADEIREIYLIRQALESLAAECAARNASDEDIQKIGDLIGEIEKASGDPDASQPEIFELNKSFSEAYNNASHMPTLVRMIESLKEQMTHCRQVSLKSAERKASALQEHRAMLEALKNRDAALAAERAGDHIKNAYSAYLSSINNEHH